MALASFQSDSREFNLMQSQWAAQLNPVLGNPMTNPTILKDINIVTGTNVINHLLGQNQQGWFIVDTNAAITLYRSEPMNDKTLTLVSNGAAIVSLAVY